ATRLLIAERDGEPIAASLVLAWGEHGVYLAAGSTAQGLEHRASHLLQWHAINWAKERGAKTWDLWGIADARGQVEIAAANGSDRGSPEMTRLEAAAKRDPLDGVYRFKKGWGGDVVRTCLAYDRVFIRPAYWLWQMRRGEA
ncbi:MAG: peptidoglycan bridge formation glycyltransferase FemA/FemB family protein, partial [Chloroflexota bacterium]